MKIPLTLLLLLYAFCCSFAQSKGYKCRDIPYRPILSLYEGKYCIKIVINYPPHTERVHIISSGKYETKNGKLILIDDSLLITTLKYQTDSTLIVLNGFVDFVGKVFKPTIFYDIECPPSKCRIVDYDKTSNLNYESKFEGQTYTNHPNISFTDYKIRFEKRYYYFTFKEITLIKGRWRKRGNDLLLFHNNTGFSYYFKIIGKTLQPIKFFSRIIVVFIYSISKNITNRSVNEA